MYVYIPLQLWRNGTDFFFRTASLILIKYFALILFAMEYLFIIIICWPFFICQLDLFCCKDWYFSRRLPFFSIWAWKDSVFFLDLEPFFFSWSFDLVDFISFYTRGRAVKMGLACKADQPNFWIKLGWAKIFQPI